MFRNGKNMGNMGRFGSLQVIGNVTIRYNAYDFPSSFIKKSICLSFTVFSRYSQLLVRSCKFLRQTLAFGAPD